MNEQEQKTILLVEDEALIAVMEKETLKKHGFNVILASSGEKAIEISHTTPDIDLILMDINLGKGRMDGTEAAEIILKEKDIPILFLSSYTQPEVVEKTEKITSYGYVTKDSGETVLIASIKMAFRLHEAHRKVEQSAKQFRAITDASIDGFWILDSEGHILDVNDACCAMTGYSRDEFVKMSISDLEVNEDAEAAKRHMQRVIKQGSDHFESRHRRKDGKIIDVEVRTRFIHEQRIFLAFLHEITERKLAEEKLKESEEKYRTLIDTSNEGIWMMNGDHETTYVNHAMAHMMGYDPSEMLGKNVEHFFFPEDMEFHTKRMQKRHAGEDEVYERRFRQKDGSELWTLVSAKALKDGRDKFSGSIAMFTDITEHKLSEKSLKESEERLRLAHKAANDVIWDWDIIHDTQRWNEAGTVVFGWTEIVEGPVNAHWWVERVHPDDRQRVDEKFFAVVNDPETDHWSDEYRFLKTDGSYAEVMDRGYVLRDAQGKAVRMIGAMLDITSRKLAEEAVKKSERTLKALIDATSDAAFVIDKNGTYLVINEIAAARLNKTINALVGTSAYDLPDADLAQKRRAKVNEVVTSGKPLIFVDQRGGLLLENRLYPVFGAQNRVEMVAVYSRDITESELNVEELRYAYARLEALWGIAKMTDDDFQTICDKILSEIVVMTKSEYGFFGFISEDESTMTIHSWSGEAMKNCSMVDKPQHFPISEAGVWAEAIRKRTPFVMNDYIISHEAKKGYPDGHVTITNLLAIPVFSGDRIISVAAVANKAAGYDDDDINQITAFVGAVHAIIDRKRAEEQLQKNLERLDMAQTAANAGVWDWEIPTGHIEWSSHMFHLFGVDPLKNTASFETWKSIVHPDDIETAVLRIDQALKQQAVLNSDYRVVMPDGRIRWINAVGQGQYDTSGNPIRMIGFCVDITERKRLEEALYKSGVQFRAVADYTYDWEAWIGPDGKLIWTSPAVLRISGYSAEECTDMTDFPFILVYEIDRDKMAKLFKSAIQGSSGNDLDFRIRCKDGDIKWVSMSWQSIYDDKGTSLGYRSSIRDVVSRKQAEDALQESERRLADIIQFLPDATIAIDRDKRVIVWNNAIEEITGIPAAEMIGQGDYAYTVPFYGERRPQLMDLIFEYSAETAARYPAIIRQDDALTIEAFCKALYSGKGAWVFAKASPLYDASGHIIGAIESIRDITKFKQAEEALRERDEILSATQRLAKVGGWQWDVATQTMSWTEEAYQIHDLEEDRFIPGSPEHIDRSLECYAPEHRPLIIAAFKNCVEHGQPYDLEFPFVTFKGRRLWIRTSAQAVPDKGRIVKVMGNIMDITDRKQAEDKIESLLSEKELLLREVHHRIKNNMSIIMSLFSLQSSTLKDPSAVAALEGAGNRVRSMMVLYDKLYRSSDFRELSAKEYLTSLIDEIVINFPNRGLVTIETQIDDFILDAKTLSPVGMILNELLTNTMKHAFPQQGSRGEESSEFGVRSRQDKRIIIALRTREDLAVLPDSLLETPNSELRTFAKQITLSVSDNGIGIPESIDIANTTGFGLQLVGILTEQLEGTIRIERENGTRFVLEFERQGSSG